MSISDTVNTWFRERLACGALARDTEAYNQVSAALPDLIARLGGPAVESEPEAAAAAEAVAPAKPPKSTSAKPDAAEPSAETPPAPAA